MGHSFFAHGDDGGDDGGNGEEEEEEDGDDDDDGDGGGDATPLPLSYVPFVEVLKLQSPCSIKSTQHRNSSLLLQCDFKSISRSLSHSLSEVGDLTAISQRGELRFSEMEILGVGKEPETHPAPPFLSG